MKSILEKTKVPFITLKEKKGRFVDDNYTSLSYIVCLEEGKVFVLEEKGAVLTILREGEVYGISNLFNDKALPARLKCEEASTLRLYPKKEVKEALLKDESLISSYCALMNDKISFLVGRLELISSTNNRERLCRYLLTKDRPVFERREELSSYLFMGRSALFRELRYLEDKGLLSCRGKDFVVLEEEKLRSEIK